MVSFIEDIKDVRMEVVVDKKWAKAADAEIKHLKEALKRAEAKKAKSQVTSLGAKTGKLEAAKARVEAALASEKDWRRATEVRLTEVRKSPRARS